MTKKSRAKNQFAGYFGHRVGDEPGDESEHFYRCPTCGQEVDKRDLGAVMHHEHTGHQPLPPQIVIEKDD